MTDTVEVTAGLEHRFPAPVQQTLWTQSYTVMEVFLCIPGPHLLDGRRTPTPHAMTNCALVEKLFSGDSKTSLQGLAGSWGCFQPSTSVLCVLVSKSRICTVGSHCIYTDPNPQGDLSPQLGRSNKNIWSVIINLMSHGKW